MSAFELAFSSFDEIRVRIPAVRSETFTNFLYNILMASLPSLAWAHPVVQEWFVSKFGTPTEPQEQ